ncbi:MAG: CHASE3 domain-containing protein [Anaerolineae bacterium]|nr:CHASE3 domain-containing protein [Anaerolineae bacterium]
MKGSHFVSTQSRLNLVFTLLFLVGVIILTGFIKTSIDAMAYNAEARTTYTQARQLYQAQLYLQQFEKALNDYELTGDYDMLAEYQSSYARLQQSLVEMAATSELPEERAALDQLIQDLAALRQHFDQVVQAVDEEEWDAVVALDAQAYALVDPIFDQIDRLIGTRSDALSELRSEVSTFTDLAWLTIALAPLLFLVAAVVVAWITARQVHIPLMRMTDELKQVQEGQFDPAALAPLAGRRDEIGYLAREYLQMAAAVLQRQASLKQTAGEIRAKIR